MSRITRRHLIGSSVAAAAGSALWTSISPSLGALGANDKMRVGLIGSGGRGRADILTFLQNDDVECPIICDVDDAMLAEGVKVIEKARGKAPEPVKDFRKVVERKDLDAVVVGTPDHWHALPTIRACEAGKDVYCEKPLAMCVGEGRAMVNAARKHDRVVQMGTQWRSSPHFAEAVEYVQSGKLGKIRLVRCWAYLNWVHSVGSPKDQEKAPDGVDYDMWLGPAPKRPFNPARFHFSFRWFWDYAGGLMTDWGVHLINVALWAMKAGMPDRVSSSGGKYIYNDISDTPDTQFAVYDYPGFAMVWEHQMTGSHGCEDKEHGVAFYGTEATLVVGAYGWEVTPEQKDKRVTGDQEPVPTEKNKTKPAVGQVEHVRNFLDCMRSRKRSVEDVEIGHAISTAAHLGNLALRSKATIIWDARNERPVGRTDLDDQLLRPYRAPWKLEG
jgi:predicted dehydrogenase